MTENPDLQKRLDTFSGSRQRKHRPDLASRHLPWLLGSVALVSPIFWPAIGTVIRMVCKPLTSNPFRTIVYAWEVDWSSPKRKQINA